MMRWFRSWHRWVSMAVTIPFFITILTGILLASRGFNSWVQPDYRKVQASLKLSFDQLLEIAKSSPQAKIQSWDDVSQIDIRPSQGNVRIRSKHDMWELQINGETGEILSSRPRRVSWLVALHEGAYFGNLVRYGIFFPSAIGVLFLLLSGVYLYLRPLLRKQKSSF